MYFCTAAVEDFLRLTQNQTIIASDDMNKDFVLTIPIIDDAVYEDVEAFLIVVEAIAVFPNGTLPSEQVSLRNQSFNIEFVNDGVILAAIIDDDGQYI